MSKANLGLIGLAVIGENLVMNMESIYAKTKGTTGQSYRASSVNIKI